MLRSMLRMCSGTLLPTSCGVRMVVSEIGVILSPKYAPEMTAPAVISGETPMTRAIVTRATPIVAAVVQEEPVASPTTPVTRAAAK